MVTMTSKSEQFKALANKFVEDVAALLDDKAERKAKRHAKHPAEPIGASLVKVFFTGDKSGNTFAVCHPTTETKRIRQTIGGREQRVTRKMWKYSYEQATGTSNKRSWVGMLKTLDGHGREATRIEIYRPSGAEVIDLT
jgi:hypothetical protein